MGPSRKLTAIPGEMVSVSSVVDPAYVDAFSADLLPGHGSSPEDWARRTYEGAPTALRWLLLAGWRVGLGLRLEPQWSLDCVLGWRITGRGANWVRVEQHSRLLTGQLVFWVGDQQLVQVTFVRYDRSMGRWLWTAVSVIHRRLVPYLLEHAAKRYPAGVPTSSSDRDGGQLGWDQSS